LFVGDVGRPDLLDGKMTKEELASMLFDSLQTKIKVLPDEVLVYPAHGPGSSCGKNIGKETWSTIGQQKETNYAMRIHNREDFIAAVTDGLSAPPQYFFADAMINKQGYMAIDEVMERNLNALSAADVKKYMAEGALVLDVRTPDEFEQGYIPSAINIGLEGTFAVWVGTLIDIKQKLILVAAEGREREAVARLARVGYEQVVGFLSGGISSWKAAGNAVTQVQSVDAQAFAQAIIADPEVRKVIDVRKPGEYEGGHVLGSEMFCLSKFGASENLEAISKTQPYYVHCAGGYRSMIAISVLQAKGYTNLINVRGGWAQIKTTLVPQELPEHA
ncbi:MAG: rhodanese-like domain-containing protein, partial [Bacteroidia bacterium]